MRPAPNPFRRALLAAIAAGLPACGSCDKKPEPTVVIVDDGGARRPAFRPLDRFHRDASLPLVMPRGSASSDAPAVPIE